MPQSSDASATEILVEAINTISAAEAMIDHIDAVHAVGMLVALRETISATQALIELTGQLATEPVPGVPDLADPHPALDASPQISQEPSASRRR
jgi:hypothetical protein